MIIGALLNSRSSVPVNKIVLSRGPAMNSGHDADDSGAQGTDAEKRNAESAHSEALDEARYSEYRAEKQSADRAEQNGSDDDRNRYKSYLDGSGFEITERCECHDDYQSGEQCGEHETHEFLPRCGS